LLCGAADEKNNSMKKESGKGTTDEAGQLSFFKIHPDDNVLVALKTLSSGTSISFANDKMVTAAGFFVRP
jgi:hypothetical protein